MVHFHFSISHIVHEFATSLFPGFFRPVCFLKAHLFILWAYDPLFMPLGFNGFLYPHTNFFLPMLLGFFLLLGFPKMSINSYTRANYIIV